MGGGPGAPDARDRDAGAAGHDPREKNPAGTILTGK
jgi:hypothetical protein